MKVEPPMPPCDLEAQLEQLYDEALKEAEDKDVAEGFDIVQAQQKAHDWSSMLTRIYQAYIYIYYSI